MDTTSITDLFDLKDLQAAAWKELDRRKRSQIYLRDAFLFQKYVLCDPDRRELLGRIHSQGLRFISTSTRRRKMVLWPRGHLKSTVLTQGEALRRALMWPNIRVLISSQKVDNAKSFLAGIKGHLQDPRFVELYGNLLPDTKQKAFKNNDFQLTLTHRKNQTLREPTFQCTGPDAEKTSQHYDLIIHDDVVGRETVTNIQQIEKTYQYYKDCIYLLEPPKRNAAPPEVWIIGTRWHPIDLYGWLIDGATDPRCRESRFKEHVPNCYCLMDVSIRSVKEDGEFIWPEVFNEQYLQELITADGLDHFSVACQFYNNPTDPSTCWFKEQDVKKALITPSEFAEVKKGLEKSGKRLTWYVAVDPAESTSSSACLSAAVAVGVDHETGIWYVDWAEGRKVETAGFCDLAMEAWKRYTPEHYGMESHTKAALEYALRQRMIQTNTLFSIEELKPNKVGDARRTKETRIKQLVAMFEFGRIRINTTCKDLLDEIYTLPSSIHWDLCDALAYVFDMVPSGVGAGKFDSKKLPRRVVGWKSIGY
jgi:hypothetical protein